MTHKYCKALKPKQSNQPTSSDVLQGCKDGCHPEWLLSLRSLCIYLSSSLAGLYIDSTSAACIYFADLGLAPKAGGIVAVHPTS